MVPKVPLLLLLSFLGINPTLVPVVVAAENKCFADRAELKYAIDVCFEGGLGDRLCHTDTDTDVAECERVKETYGWPLNSWCVGEVTDMHFLFVEKRDFNEDISAWDVSQVTNMYETFSYASSFNCDLSKWDTSKVWKMFGMFNGCEAFDGDISTWDTSSLTDMKWMFYGATVFNGDLSRWDVSKVTDMYEAFASAPAFNGDISCWNVTRVTDMSGLFWEAAAFNIDISGWDLSSVTNMEYAMFYGATSFNQDLCAWRETFPYSVASRTFGKTACAFRATPKLEDKGPFCASNCSDPEPGGLEDTELRKCPPPRESLPLSTPTVGETTAAPGVQGEDAATEAAVAGPTTAVPAEELGEGVGEQAPSSAPICSPSVLAVGLGISCWWTFFYG